MSNVLVTKAQITIADDDQTKIHNPELAELAEKHPVEIAKTLSTEICKVDAADLSVDSAGRVCIKDANFTKKINEKMEMIVADAGIICPTNAVFC